MPKVKHLLFITLLFGAMLACNYVAPTPQPTATPLAPTAIPEQTVIIEPTAVPTRSDLPRDEAAVPRVPVEQAKAALDSGAAIIVDVRGADSYAAGHIKGAISIPLAEIENNPTGLNLDKNQWIITYCTWYQEHTSARAAFVMLQNGYQNVTPILGGFEAWINAGYPTEP